MNRIQRVRRFRLASLALSMVAVLAVSLPAATPALAAPGDTLTITPSAISAGPSGSTFTARVSSNTSTPMGGIQASVTFDNTKLNVVSITRVAGFWGSATLLLDGSNVATSNTNGKVGGWAASYITTTGSATGADVPFLDIVFRVIACPANGQAGVLGLPTGPADGNFLDTSGGSITPASVSTSTVSCTPPAANDFSIGASPTTVTIPQGGTGVTAISTTLTSGAAQAAVLSSSALPANVTAAFTAPSLSGNASTNLTFTVGVAAAIGSYPISVTGTGPDATRSVVVTLAITPPPSGPAPATGTTTVSGTVDQGFLGVSVQANTSLRLLRNRPNETSVPVLIFSNTQWTLSIEDAMTGGKLGPDRGHMLDTAAVPQKRLAQPMQAYATPFLTPPGALIRTLDLAGAQSLKSGALSTTVDVTLLQQTVLTDPPGNYAIDLTFSAISGF